MFWNIYKASILNNIRQKEVIRWIILFPLLLATLFFFAFSSIDENELIDIIPIGVITDNSYEEDIYFKEFITSLSEGEDKVFKATFYKAEADAIEDLKNKEISSYINYENNGPTLITIENGLNQSITKSILDNYLQTTSNYTNILMTNPATNIDNLSTNSSYTSEISLNGKSQSFMVHYFYALIGMMCLFGSILGAENVNYIQANLSPLGARQSVSPVKKYKLVLFNLLGSLTIHVFTLIILLIYIILILNIDFGSNILLILLACLIGSILGISFGAFVSSATKLKSSVKTGILTGLTMTFTFLSGMMGGQTNNIQYLVATKFPILSWLNPVTRISDSFYSLYFYDDLSKYSINMGIVIIMSIVLIIGTSFFIRRQRYDSI